MATPGYLCFSRIKICLACACGDVRSPVAGDQSGGSPELVFQAIRDGLAASGLERLLAAQRNPLITTSFGTGELIWHALNKGGQSHHYWHWR